MRELMIDIETLGSTVRSPVLEIGSVVFEGNNIIAEDLQRLDLQQQFNLRRMPDWSTLTWWMAQNPAVREQVFGGYRGNCQQALQKFHIFVDKQNPQRIWCKGLSFDLPIIESLLMDFKLPPPPWKFWDTRDARTVIALLGKDGRVKAQNAHSSIDDCRHQIKLLNMARDRFQLPVA